MERKKVDCGCLEGECFLEKDMECMRENIQEISRLRMQPNLSWKACEIDADRLQEKGKWYDSLRVNGGSEICCWRESKESHIESIECKCVQLKNASNN